MGQVFPGIHPTVALHLKDTFGLKCFVETGTYMGNTVKWAIDNFDKVISIEITKAFHKHVLNTVHSPNLQLILGDSATKLAEVCASLNNEPTLFWLDAHWTGEKEYPLPYERFPLLDEISAINNNFSGVHAIMVDDYSLWVAPRQKDIFPLLRGTIGRQFAIVDDVVIACTDMPLRYKEG